MVWAPSWVSWREGGGYVGWAPLPPDSDFEGGIIVAERVVVEPRFFVFVEHRHFCEPIRPSVLVVNQTVIHKTVNITRITRVNNTVINNGPSLNVIERNNPGRVVKVKVERQRTMPAEVIKARQAQRESGQITRPEVIRGARRQADRTAEVRLLVTKNIHRRASAPTGQAKKELKRERTEGRRQTPVPPSVVVVQPTPRPLAPTAATSAQDETGRGQGRGHKKYLTDEDETAGAKGK